jgi:site-specific recombinase XerD
VEEPPVSELMSQMSAALRSRHYSRRTEQAYCLWVRRFIRFHGLRHPDEMAEPEINAFLTHLAVDEHVSASTQNQALSALLFLYRHVLGRQVGELGDVIRARRPRHLPVVLTRHEVKAILAELDGDKRLMASLMYGGGLRLSECLRLHVQDVDFSRAEIIVRDGKGGKDRVTMLPRTLQVQLPGPWIASTRTLRPTGAGNGSFRRRGGGETPRPASKVATTSTRRSSSGR